MSSAPVDFSDLGAVPVGQPDDFSDLGAKAVQQPEASPNPNIDMSKVAGATPGTPSPAQVAKQPTADRPVGKLTGFQAATHLADLPRSSAEQQGTSAAIGQALTGGNEEHPVEGFLRQQDPMLASLPVGAYETGAGLHDAAVGIAHRDPNAAARGGTRALSGAMEAGAIPMGTGVAQAPIRMGIGYLEAIAAGKSAEYAAKKIGLSPDEQEFANSVATFLPMFYHTVKANTTLINERDLSQRVPGAPEGTSAKGVQMGPAGAMVTETPAGQKVLRTKVGPFTKNITLSEGNQLPPAPVDPAAQVAREQAQTSASAMADADALDQAAKNMANGVQPQQPGQEGSGKAPLPAGMERGQITPETVQNVGKAIAMAPPEARGAMIAEAHQNLAEWMAQQGKVQGPDGQITMVKNPEQAQQLAAKWINDEVGQQQKAQEGAQKAQQDAQKAQEKAANDAQKAQAKAQKEAQKQAGQQQKEREKAGEPTIEQRAKTLLDTYPERDPVAVLQRNLGLSEGEAKNLADHVHQNAPIEAAPKVGGEGHEVIEEARATVDKQVAALQAGTIKAVHIPEGSTYTPKIPDGMKAVDIKNGPGAGRFIYNPQQIRAATIKEAAKAGTHGDILGHVTTTQQAAQSENPAVVQARDQDGTVIQDSAVDGANPGAVQAQAENLHERHPDAHISVVQPHEALNERIEAKNAEEPPKDFADLGAVPVETKYKFGNTQATIPEGSDAHTAMRSLQSRIADEDLAGVVGKDEDKPHVTVRYGIQGDDTSGIRKYIESQAPFEARLGKTASFPPSEHSDGAAPIIAPVESPELHRINAEIEQHGDFTKPSFKEYKPHATVAYVKPESAPKYEGMADAHGKTFRVDSIDISDRYGNKETVQLKGKLNVTEDQSHPATEVKPAKPAEAAGPGPATPEVAKGARVTFTDRSGKERTGTAQFTDGRIVRIKADDDKKTYTGAIEKVKPTTAEQSVDEVKPGEPISGEDLVAGMRVRVTKIPPGSYLTAGEEYTIPVVSKSGTVQFKRDSGAGTMESRGAVRHGEYTLLSRPAEKRSKKGPISLSEQGVDATMEASRKQGDQRPEAEQRTNAENDVANNEGQKDVAVDYLREHHPQMVDELLAQNPEVRAVLDRVIEKEASKENSGHANPEGNNGTPGANAAVEASGSGVGAQVPEETGRGETEAPAGEPALHGTGPGGRPESGIGNVEAERNAVEGAFRAGQRVIISGEGFQDARGNAVADDEGTVKRFTPASENHGFNSAVIEHPDGTETRLSWAEGHEAPMRPADAPQPAPEAQKAQERPTLTGTDKQKRAVQSEIASLKIKRADLQEKYTKIPDGHFSPAGDAIRREIGDLTKQLLAKEDELAKLSGQPTRAEKKAMQEAAASKPFDQRPEQAMTYSQPEQSQHWQVTEPDYLRKRFEQEAAQYDRGIEQQKAEVKKLKPGTKAHDTAASTLAWYEATLKRLRSGDEKAADKYKREYAELVKKAISKGSPVPEKVIQQYSEFRTAQTARERYEKGRHTSFANRSIAVNDTMQKEEGFKVKRQDGKAITDAQVKEIKDGIADIATVLGADLRDMMRGTDLTIAHTNGKNPFLSVAGGMYHPADRTISSGIEDVLGRPIRALAHELGHWLDFESGRAMDVKAKVVRGGKMVGTQYVSESDANGERYAGMGTRGHSIYSLARKTMTDTREVRRILKIRKLSDLDLNERAEVEREKVTLGPYWNEPAEIFARLFEQYIAANLGRGGLATETSGEYEKNPGWWNKDAWAKLEPMVEAEVNKRLMAMRERYAPKAPEPQPAVASTESMTGQEGKSTTLLTPSRELPATYRLVEADNLQPSHNAHTFAKNPAYPEGLQERAYDTSKEAQNRVIQQAQNYDPRYTVNTNPDAVNGPPVVTPTGIVLGGNSRAMSTQRLYAKGGDAYRAALKESAAIYGFTPEQVDAMKNPVLVRQVENPSTPDDARRLGSELNKSMTGAMGVAERAVSAGKNIKADTLRNVAAMMQADDSTLREAMGKHGSEIVKMLTADGVITERERPQFVDAATGGLSEEGKTFVERALMGTVIDDPRLMDAAPKSILQKLERSLGSITSFASRSDEWNLLPAIREAVGELGAIQGSGSTVDLRLGQTSLFGGERNSLVDAMIRALDGKPTAIRKAFDDFSRDADANLPGQARMFGNADAFDAFNHAFGSTLTAQEFYDGLDRAAATEPRSIEKAHAGDNAGLSEPRAKDAGAGGREGYSQSATGSLSHLEANSTPVTPQRPRPDASVGFMGTQYADQVLREAGFAGKKFWDADIAPNVAKLGTGAKNAGLQMAHVLYPRMGANADAQDILSRARGKLESHLFTLEHIDGGLEKFFAKMSREAHLAFIDRYKLGTGQPDLRLQQIEQMMRAIDDRSLKAAQQFRPNLTAKENHFRVIWKVIPGGEAKQGQKSAQFTGTKRPWQGDKGFMKRATLETISEGINAGGEPITTNPWKLFTLAQASIMKYVAAQQAWADAKDLGMRKFVKRGEQAPEGWVKINDRIADVYFPEKALSVDVEDLPAQKIGPRGHQKEFIAKEDLETHKVMANPGTWYAEPGFGRLLNNYLSPDHIRQSELGKGLLFAKNLTTAVELSLSPFHAIFESLEAMGSQFGLGVQRVWNNGIRLGDGAELTRGLQEIATSIAAPYSLSRTGGNVVRYAENPSQFTQTRRGQAFFKHYPDAAGAMQELFDGGLTWGVQRDFRFDPQKSMVEAAKEGNYVGAVIRAIPWVNTVLMKPLFEAYIPRLKWGLALGLYSEQLIENADALASGDTTRTEIARKVADTVENRFGEMNFNNIYWNNTFKSVLQLAFRSVTWKLGNWRGAGSAMGPEMYQAFRDPLAAMKRDWQDGGGYERRHYLPRIGMNQGWLLGMLFTTAVLGTIATKFWTHKWPWEVAAEDRDEGYSFPGAVALEMIHPRTGRTNEYTGKPERISLPTGLRDFEHFARDPRGYIKSSSASWASHAYDTLENRDVFKNYVYDPNGSEYQKLAQIFAYNMPKPISYNNLTDKYGPQDATSKALKMSGLGNASSSLDYSPAEQKMRGMKEHDPLTPEQVKERNEEHMHPTPKELRKQLKARNMPYVERLFKGLGYAQAREVYNSPDTSDHERQLLHKMMREKRQRYLKASR